MVPTSATNGKPGGLGSHPLPQVCKKGRRIASPSCMLRGRDWPNVRSARPKEGSSPSAYGRFPVRNASYCSPSVNRPSNISCLWHEGSNHSLKQRKRPPCGDLLLCSGAGIRTPIAGSRDRCTTIVRPPKMLGSYSWGSEYCQVSSMGYRAHKKMKKLKKISNILDFTPDNTYRGYINPLVCL